jgi:cytochrome c oxidase subunit 1
MTTNVPVAQIEAGRSIGRPNYLNITRGFWSWAGTLDHKRIGIMYLVGVSAAFLVGGILALLIRTHLWTPEGALFEASTYNRVFTLHGVFMVFIFIIPAIPASLGNVALPLMLGAKDVALPRLNLASFYLWFFGTALALYSIINGGIDTGWTFYTPYSIASQKAVVSMGLAVFTLGFSSIFTGLNFIVTIHKLRAPGQTWFKMPLFCWAIYATAILQVLATPVLGITVLLLAFEHIYHIGIFDPLYGGDAVLFQHFFWFYSHPAVYIMILPAMAVISEVVCAFSRKNIFGYKAVAYSSLGIAFVGFFTWGHHLFTSGQSAYNAGVFGVLTMFVGIFTAIKVFNWVATMYKGAISFKTPFIYFVGFLFFLFFGGMTGVALATVSLDIHWQDTYFVVAHFHFIMVGSTMMAFLAALHYWWPKLTGRTYNERWGLVAAVFVILGFVFTFLPQFLLGNEGMPRRYFSYPERYWMLNVASTAGASVLAIGFTIVLVYILVALRHGAVAGANPWGSRGYEWLTPSPPPLENFEEVPAFTRGPHEYHDLPDAAGVEGATAGAPQGARHV